VEVKRSYHSDLRREHAETTRRRIVDGADKLFREVGYERATVAAIAQAAQVAVQTLYGAFSSKEEIGVAVVERTVIESGIREAVTAGLVEPDPERAIRGITAAATKLYASQSGIMALLSMEFAAVVLRMADGFRLSNLRELMASPSFRRRLRPGLTPETAAMNAWAVSGIETYRRLVHDSSWGHKRYERWLSETVIHQTLVQRRGRSR
jgi:AcrR family transcriptional regulator